MTEPTLESLNEAARAVDFRDWGEFKMTSHSVAYKSIRAHALTLDELHGRKEVSEAETFYREVLAARLGRPSWSGELDDDDIKAIALIEAKFAELRAPKEPEWIEWNGGECPVDGKARVEVKLRDGVKDATRKACDWRWSWFSPEFISDIIAYRVLS